MREAGSGPVELWEVPPWVVALAGDVLHRGESQSAEKRRRMLDRIAAGEEPRVVLGLLGRRLPLEKSRGVEWVPSARTVLIRDRWWTDPWRLTFADAGEGERLFGAVAARLPGAGARTEARVGPHDLAMDPRLAIGVVSVIGGLVALIGGAIEGVGQGPAQGPAARFRIFAVLGEAIGPAAAMAVGALVLAAGVAGLVLWHRNRPTKWVVRAGRWEPPSSAPSDTEGHARP